MIVRFPRLALIVLSGFLVLGCGGATAEEHLERALGFRAAGDVNSAVIELKNALQQNPDLGEARLALGELHLELGDLESAVKELERALDLGVAKDRVLPPLLEAKVDLGLYQEVLGALDEAVMTPRLQVVRGEALMKAGERDEARADFEAALEADAALPRAYLGMAELGLEGASPDYEAAEAALRRGTEAVPGNRRLWLALGELELNRQRAAEAAIAFENARKLGGVDFMAEIGLSRARLLEDKPDEAKALIEGVLVRVPKHPLAQHIKGVIVLQENDLRGAESAFETVLSVAPEYPPTLLALAHVKHAQGQPNQSESYLRQLVARDPENPAGRKALAALLVEVGRPDDAIEALTPVAAKMTEGRDLALLGTAYLQAGRLDEASRYLAAAAEAMPESGEVKTQLAASLAAAGDNAAALAQLDAMGAKEQMSAQSEALRVLVHLRSGDLDAALAAANQFVASNLDTPLAYNLVGAVQLARKDVPAARQAYESSLAANPAYGPAAISLSRLDVADGKPADARKRLERVLESDPRNVDVRIALARVQAESGDVDGAIAALQQGRQLLPDALAPRVALGRLAFERGDLTLANEVSEEAERIAAESPDVLLLRAQVSQRLGQPDAFARYLDRLQAFVAAAPEIAAAYRLPLGDLQRQAGRLDLARANLDQALVDSPAKTQTLVALVQLEVASGDATKARQHLKELEKAGADRRLLRELEGDLGSQTSDLAGAAAAYAEASSAGSRTATSKLALVQARQGRPADAIATLQGWLSKHPDDRATARLLATIRLESGDKAAAQKDYERLLEQGDEDPSTLNNLAWIYFEAGDGRAEPLARRAVAAAPESAAVADTLGWILAHSDKQGAANEAVSVLERASRAAPTEPSILYHLAVAQDKAGRRREALVSVERALDLGQFPDLGDAQELASALRAR